MTKYRSHDKCRLLVITLSNIGDLVMTTPVFEALTDVYPGTKIDVVADTRSSSLLRAAPYIGTIHHRVKSAGARAQLHLLRSLRQNHYLAVVDLRTNIIPWLVHADLRLSKPLKRVADQHAVLEHFSVLKKLTGIRPPPPCRIYVNDEMQTRATQLLRELPPGRWLVLGPGANWPGKRWPQTRYYELLQASGAYFDAAIILGSLDDSHPIFAKACLAIPVVDLCGQTDLPTAAAILTRASVFVGNDSGLGHMAAALSIPTLTVFGPGDPLRYRPWGTHAQVVYAPQADLAQLEVATVMAALRRLIAGAKEQT